MKALLISFYVVVLVAMLVVVTLAILHQNMFEAGGALMRDPWFVATLADAYLAVLSIALWIAWKERFAVGAWVWVLAVLGLGNIAIGDAQLAAFKRDPANRGKVMDRGLWRYTRHPNYFGDATLWWGLGLFALSTPGAWWTLLGPALMTTLLLRVSGVSLLEKSMSKRPGYAKYVARTSAFFPLPPKLG